MKIFICFIFFIMAASLIHADKVYEDLEVIESSAKRGNAYYQGLLSEVYRKGLMGQEKDYVKALEWAQKSAKSKNPIGLYNLAVIYESGLGAPKKSGEAEKLYHEAFKGMKALAEQDDASAQYNLGYMLLHGKGCEKDEKQAVEWLTKSAIQGNMHAMYCLGYELAQKKKTEEAHKWFFKAARQGHSKAQYLTGIYFLKNAPLVKKGNPDALLWIGKSATQGEPEAQFMMASMYFYGKGIDRDVEKAIYWYQRAAAQGHKGAIEKMEFFVEQAKSKK
jgi:TPR repeat protein